MLVASDITRQMSGVRVPPRPPAHRHPRRPVPDRPRATALDCQPPVEWYTDRPWLTWTPWAGQWRAVDGGLNEDGRHSGRSRAPTSAVVSEDLLVEQPGDGRSAEAGRHLSAGRRRPRGRGVPAPRRRPAPSHQRTADGGRRRDRRVPGDPGPPVLTVPGTAARPGASGPGEVRGSCRSVGSGGVPGLRWAAGSGVPGPRWAAGRDGVPGAHGSVGPGRVPGVSRLGAQGGCDGGGGIIAVGHVRAPTRPSGAGNLYRASARRL